jgi:hypothetical protein
MGGYATATQAIPPQQTETASHEQAAATSVAGRGACRLLL